MKIIKKQTSAKIDQFAHSRLCCDWHLHSAQPTVHLTLFNLHHIWPVPKKNCQMRKENIFLDFRGLTNQLGDTVYTYLHSRWNKAAVAQLKKSATEAAHRMWYGIANCQQWTPTKNAWTGRKRKAEIERPSQKKKHLVQYSPVGHNCVVCSTPTARARTK